MKTEVISIPSLKCEITFTIGQNADENNQIIDAAYSNDIWFHVDRKNLKYIISQGAVLCKKHSYPKEKSLPIVFTRVKNIQKTNTPGMVFIPEDCKSVKVI